MSTFAQAFNKTTNKTTTENNAVVEQSTGYPVLDFSHKVVRSTTGDEIQKRVDEIINYAQTKGDVNAIHDLFVMMFHKRNPRGGEGEKQITYTMLLNIYNHYPDTIVKLVHLLADFGYYKDFYQIWEAVSNLVTTETEKITGTEKNQAMEFYFTKYNPLISEIVKYTIQQRNSDLDTLKKDGKNISLIGKWIPREGGHFAKKCHWYQRNREGMLIRKTLVDLMVWQLAVSNGTMLDTNKKYPTYWYQTYRRGNSLLTKKLAVPEIAMCAGNYADIKFENVASRAMAKYRKAFMNEKLKEVPKPYQETTGNRHPDNKDRVQSRRNLKTMLEGKAADKLKATTMEPHEIMSKIMSGSVSNMEKEVLTTMWENKKTDVKKHLAEVMATMKELGQVVDETPRPGKIIPMVDVSESMQWQNTPSPMAVAIAMGIMTAELHEDDSPFKDTLISFTDVPSFFKFRPEQTLTERYNEVNRHKGYNTNFRLAMEELLKMCIQNKVAEDDIPDLLVFTDGQFDAWGPRGTYTSMQQTNHWTTHHEELMKLWAAGGYTKIPRIIYWNLRGGTPGVQTSANHPGVQMLQGFSPNLIKFILYGESFGEKTQEVEIDGKIVKMKVSSVTPLETFRAIIDQSKYDVVRIMLDESDEKMLSKYSFKPPQPETDNVEEELAEAMKNVEIVEKPTVETEYVLI